MIPVLETERLVLRDWRLSDFPGFAAFWADPEASAHMGGPADELGAWMRFTSQIGHWQMRGFGMWMLEDQQSGQSIGHAGGWFPATWPGPEIGWAIYPQFQRRGFAFEAARAVLAFLGGAGNWTTAVSLIRQSNRPSRTLAETLGARLEKSTDFRGIAGVIYRHDLSAFCQPLQSQE